MRISKPPAERQAELIAAARTLIDERGVEGLRVSDIVTRVGVAQGVFYYYFHSKQEVIDVVVHTINEELQTRIGAIIADCQSDFSNRVAQYIQLYIRYIDGFLPDDATDTKSLFYNTKDPMRTGRGLIIEGWQRLIRQGVEEDTLHLHEPELAAAVLMHGLEAASFKKLPTLHQIFDVVEQGLGLPENSVLKYLPPTT